MLEKLVAIKSIGRFRDYGAAGNVTFSKITLIYAENGRGKTTLCAILRSLQSGEAYFIAERKTLAATIPPYAHIRLGGADYRFVNNAWTTTHPDILVFDPVFVNENVHSGDYVDHEHKKNLYRVIVGTTGVQLARQIEDLNDQIFNANTDIRVKKDAVTLPPGVTVDQYLAWQPGTNIDAEILQKTQDLAIRQAATARSGEIQAKGLLRDIQLPTLPADFADLLAKTLADVASDAETRVRQQVAQHQMGPQGESWLAQGLTYATMDGCPFCGQSIESSDIVAAYRSHFNEAYRDLKQEVSQLSRRIEAAIGTASVFAVQQAISENSALAEFWRQFVPIYLSDLSASDFPGKYATLHEQAQALITRKQNSPVDLVVPDTEFADALAEIAAIQSAAVTYNTAVQKANTQITAQKGASQSDSDSGVSVLKSDLARMEAIRQRFDTDVDKACRNYTDAVAAKRGLEEQKEAKRQELDRHCESLLTDYQQSINDYLDQFNAGFRIANSRHLYTGGTPSSHFQIEINNTTIDLGDQRTPPGTPCFKTALSAGDRSALALALFLAALKQDPQIAQRIVVFDDPFTSLDRFRRTCTQQLIQRLSDSAKQVVVLSHDPFFLKLLADECPARATIIKPLQISKIGDGSAITEWDIDAAVQSTYMKDYAALLAFYMDRTGDPRGVARTIRPFLEGMLRGHFPGQFAANEWLGDFIGRIRSAGSSSGLQHAKANLTELDAINGYSKKYHHEQNANADSEPINDDELHGYVKRTLRLVGGC